MTRIRVSASAEVTPGRPHLVDAGGTRMVLVRVGERIHALGETCAHQGGPLSEGKLSGTRLACPWHGWMYDVRTGQCVLPARGAGIPRYDVKVEGEDVWVEAP